MAKACDVFALSTSSSISPAGISWPTPSYPPLGGKDKPSPTPFVHCAPPVAVLPFPAASRARVELR